MSREIFTAHLENSYEYPQKGIIVGNPDRAAFIAHNFLENVELLNTARGLMAYRGTFKGEHIFVQTTGMGGPSAALVLHELVKLGAKQIVRVGTCFSPVPNELGRVLVIRSAFLNDGTSLAYAQKKWGFVERWVASSLAELGVRASSTDTYYDPHFDDKLRVWAKQNIVAVDMETSTFYVLSRSLGYSALSILVISDKMSSNNNHIHASKIILKRGILKATQAALKVLTHD